MAHSTVVGVDLGGTNVRAALYGADSAQIGKTVSGPSFGHLGVSRVVEATASVIESALEQARQDPEVIGVAAPGVIDPVQGVIRMAGNLLMEQDGRMVPWVDVPLAQLLSERLRKEVRLGNDANLAALGEYRDGSGENNARCLVMLTLGTGVGGGVVFSPTALQGDVRGPTILLGGTLGGAELGHLVVQHGGLDCQAGSYGSLEAYCQIAGIVNRAQHRLDRGRDSLLRPFSGALTPEHIFEAAQKGDEVAIEVWEETGTWLGVGIGVCLNLFAPDVFAIGGNVAKAGEFLLKSARRSARNTAIPTIFDQCKIGVARCIEDAGLRGAAALARG